MPFDDNTRNDVGCAAAVSVVNAASHKAQAVGIKADRFMAASALVQFVAVRDGQR
jgi:hypothetical protein